MKLEWSVVNRKTFRAALFLHASSILICYLHPIARENKKLLLILMALKMVLPTLGEIL